MCKTDYGGGGGGVVQRFLDEYLIGQLTIIQFIKINHFLQSQIEVGRIQLEYATPVA